MVLQPVFTRWYRRSPFGRLILHGALALAALPNIAHAQTDTASSKVLSAHKDDIQIENIADINTKSDEATPFISPADGSMYFTSSRDGKNVVYVAKRLPPGGAGDKKSHWANIQKFAELPSKQNISSLSVANDGVTAVIGICNRPDGILQSCDIYQAELVDGKLDNIVSLGKPINSEWWDGQPTISQDGQLLFFASDRKGGHGGIDIYMSSKNPDGKWGEPVNLSFNTSGDEFSPFIAKDNQTLYFAANKLPGGLGGYDIYMSRRIGQNEWTQPKNLGPTVNSARNDVFFFLPQNEDAVYLASDRDGGEGYYDIYRLYAQPTPPKPKYATISGRILDAETGQPIATTPELELVVARDGQMLQNTAGGPNYAVQVLVGNMVRIKAGADGYVQSTLEVQAPSTPDNPLTQDIRLTPAHARITGHVTNVFTHKPVVATLTLEQTGGSTQTVTSDATTGAFAFNAVPSTSYKITTTVPSYDVYSSKIDVPTGRDKMITVEKEVRLQPAQIDGVNILFDFNKSDIKKEEMAKFERFIQQVKENPYVRIEVNGHTDEIGTVEYNEKLSERRAISVEDYLLSRGVPRDQLAVVKGFGKSMPIDPSNTEEARAKNRRVEVRIVGKQD